MTQVQFVTFTLGPTNGTSITGSQIWCATSSFPATWQPIAVIESRNANPQTYQMFYLITNPSQAQGTPTPQGLTWYKSFAPCNNMGALVFNNPSTERQGIYALVGS
jgi:hypothetical protein